MNYGQPGCLSASMLGRRPSRSFVRGRRPHRHGSQGSRSRPTSPLLQSQPSSPTVYSPIPSGFSQPVFMCPPQPSGTVMVGVQHPWHYQSAPSTSTHQLSSMLSHISLGESPSSYQQQTVTYSPVVHGYQPPVYPSQVSGTQYPASYYLGSPYMHQSGLVDSRAATPDPSQHSDSATAYSVDVEDLSLRPCGVPSARLRPLRTQIASESASNVSETSSTKSDASLTPSLKLSVSSLPSPLDVPGIPIQDEVCPFHERQSEWLASSLSLYSVVLCVSRCVECV